MRLPSRPHVLDTLASLLLFLGFAAALARAEGGSFYRSFEQLGRILARIDQSYVVEVPPPDLVRAAFSGLSEILDPHSTYIEEDGLRNLRVQTEGEFGGLGITIAVREGQLTVITPLVGTPAHRMGIRAGDRILQIDGQSTRGITVEDAVSKLRGRPGTEVTISIEREGLEGPMPYTITREIIRIESVPWAGRLEGDIGYIKITQFSERTGADFRAALRRVQQGAPLRGLVVDLRYNPGGLLTQAIDVSEAILPRGDLLVSTRGRMASQNSETRSDQAPAVPPDLPLVVLLNGGSASASEIVAGAVQDQDRGVVLGTTSFGKGSVQTIFQMDRASALKLTTAHYYTPSGRGINRRENRARFPGLGEDEAQEDLQTADDGDSVTDSAVADSAHMATRQAFYTLRNRRKVYDTGGITPDIEIKAEKLDAFQQDLERRALFFRWAVARRAQVESKTRIASGFQIEDRWIDDFEAWVAADSARAAWRPPAGRILDQLSNQLLGATRDASLEGLDSALVVRQISVLDSMLKAKAVTSLRRHRQYLRHGLTRELLMAAGGDSLVTPYLLGRDVQVRAALDLLRNPVRYRALLAPPPDTAVGAANPTSAALRP